MLSDQKHALSGLKLALSDLILALSDLKPALSDLILALSDLKPTLFHTCSQTLCDAEGTQRTIQGVVSLWNTCLEVSVT